MKLLFLHILLLCSLAMRAQDRIYLLNGERKSGKVTEISGEKITYETPDETLSIYREEVLLIEYKNGIIEKFNTPIQNAIYNDDSKTAVRIIQNSKEIFAPNLFSVNTLALCNADIAGFYEHLMPDKKTGFGIMGAYNFNAAVTLTNIFIDVLYNAKKNYDLGLFANYYPGRFQKRTTFYFGVLVKYTDFSFTSVREDSTRLGNVVSVTAHYAPSKGSQLATVFTGGTHTSLTRNFFIKTMFGIGGFKLNGAYKQQVNYLLNLNKGPKDPTLNVKFLPKFYAGINAGFNF